MEILAHSYGQAVSVKSGRPLSVSLENLPWMTYPIINYLNQLDLSRESVFEWGSGGSTIFFSERTSFVESKEDSQSHFQEMMQRKIPNVKVRFEVTPEHYCKFDPGFDPTIVIIDGRRRFDCAQNLIQNLEKRKNLKLIILDNADWFPSTQRILSGLQDFYEIRFTGIGPINSYTWTTSLYISRTAQHLPKSHLEAHPLGGVQQISPEDSSYEFN